MGIGLQGSGKEFGAGSTFVLLAGFKDTWDTLEAVKKDLCDLAG